MKHTRVAAFAVACVGIAIFSSMDAVVKSLALAIGTYNTLLWRSFAAVGLSGPPWLLRKPRRPSRAVMRLHLLRGAVCAVMAVLFFWGLTLMPMAQAVALSFIAPLIAQMLAVFLLKERIARGAIIGSIAGVAGVVVILSGQAHREIGEQATWGAIAVLLSAICYAYNIILMRQQSQVANPLEVTFFQNLTVAACLLLAAPWIAEVPDVKHAPMIVLAAALASLSLLLLAWAYARAEANYLAPVEYTGFLWASLFGFLIFDEKVGWATVVGALMIVAGCLISARSAPPSDFEREVIP